MCYRQWHLSDEVLIFPDKGVKFPDRGCSPSLPSGAAPGFITYSSIYATRLLYRIVRSDVSD